MTMKISRRDISLIMIVLGLFAAFLVYQFIFRPTMEERDEVMEKRKELEAEYDDLKSVVDNQQTYVTNTTTWETRLNKLVSDFPPYYLYEDGIMYLRQMELNGEYSVYFDSYTVTETLLTDTYTGKVNGKDKVYAFGNSTISAAFTLGGYDDMKAMISSIYTDANPKSIDSISVNFDQATGLITGSMNLNMYSLTDGTNGYTAPEIPALSIGLDCIFGEIIPPEPTPQPAE